MTSLAGEGHPKIKPLLLGLAHVCSTARVHHIETPGKLSMLKICQQAEGLVVTKEQKIMKKRVLCLRLYIYNERI